jgi:hypothetical protein
LIYKIIIVVFLFLNSCVVYEFRSKQVYQRYAVDQPFDAIIVPGIPFDGKEWDKIMQVRVLWAVHLYKQGIAKNIIFSGSSVYTHFYESKIMRQYAMALGVDSNHILTESRAEHSTENVYYSFVLAREHGLTKVALATDLSQSNMVKRFIFKNELPIWFLPASIKTIEKYPLPTDITIDTLAAYNPDFVSIVQTQSTSYRFRGTLGKNIKMVKYRKL